MEKRTKNSVEAISKSMVLIGMVGLLADVFKNFMEDAKAHSAKELEEAMKKLEDK